MATAHRHIPTSPSSTPAPSLLSRAELEDVISTIGENDVSQVAYRIFEVINVEGKTDVTFADVGHHLEFVQTLRNILDLTANELQRIENCMQDLVCIASNGGVHASIPTYDVRGFDHPGLSQEQIAEVIRESERLRAEVGER